MAQFVEVSAHCQLVPRQNGTAQGYERETEVTEREQEAEQGIKGEEGHRPCQAMPPVIQLLQPGFTSQNHIYLKTQQWAHHCCVSNYLPDPIISPKPSLWAHKAYAGNRAKTLSSFIISRKSLLPPAPCHFSLITSAFPFVA